ncbi:unnamed protein product [Tilletia controversa]|uniref:Uncharacterized protein n=2 Tax=Tilletia TaxID=13289 RepID=A0A8X7MP45_9BASI|nr:hypothetical protein CF328_g5810 [Tilletia controversa]KAE8198817.1 hypothetical protein CF335_g4305 [Tilletia laevis]KAE8260056.1 hypothetical protein A4X03_0g3922 [Tilletia caries]KAE8199993.1 hypothetical protein CF336_g935 [Tilletia laevis]KAE8242873.1 hypothetical protein A4X06_0g6712 [Tilletia controversa]
MHLLQLILLAATLAGLACGQPVPVNKELDETAPSLEVRVPFNHFPTVPKDIGCIIVDSRHTTRSPPDTIGSSKRTAEDQSLVPCPSPTKETADVPSPPVPVSSPPEPPVHDKPADRPSPESKPPTTVNTDAPVGTPSPSHLTQAGLGTSILAVKPQTPTKECKKTEPVHHVEGSGPSHSVVILYWPRDFKPKDTPEQGKPTARDLTLKDILALTKAPADDPDDPEEPKTDLKHYKDFGFTEYFAGDAWARDLKTRDAVEQGKPTARDLTLKDILALTKAPADDPDDPEEPKTDLKHYKDFGFTEYFAGDAWARDLKTRDAVEQGKPTARHFSFHQFLALFKLPDKDSEPNLEDLTKPGDDDSKSLKHDQHFGFTEDFAGDAWARDLKPKNTVEQGKPTARHWTFEQFLPWTKVPYDDSDSKTAEQGRPTAHDLTLEEALSQSKVPADESDSKADGSGSKLKYRKGPGYTEEFTDEHRDRDPKTSASASASVESESEPDNQRV